MKIFSYNTVLLEHGATPLLVTNGPHFYHTKPDGTFDLSAVDLQVVAESARNTDNPQYVLIDIEEFDLKNEPERAVRNIASALWTWRQESPHTILGIYRTVPDLMYGATVHSTRVLLDRNANAARLGGFANEIRAWQSRNDYFNTAIGPALDYLCPRLYAGNDWPNWKAYAHHQLVEAKRLAQGKPVYPIMWAVYDSLTAIPLAQWKQMLEWVDTHYCVDGIMLFEHSKVQGVEGWVEAVAEYL